MLKTLLNGYLSFSRKERIGIIVLLTIIIMGAALPFCYPLFTSNKKVVQPTHDEMAALQIQQSDSPRYGATEYKNQHRYRRSYKDEAKPNVGELFYFDPNTATTADWQRLGLRDRTITTIHNYLSKGGHFYQPQDIGKIWGLHEDEVKRLLPYVRIAAAPTFEKKYNAPVYEKRKDSYEKQYQLVDINLGDTAAFIALRGIGSKLANRIVAFRNKLGGFYSIAQLAETYGLADSVLTQLKNRLSVGNTPVVQLNINELSLEALKQHPYIRYQLANAIIQYRAQHGPFAKVEDIKKIMLITEEIYAKLFPYLTVK